MRISARSPASTNRPRVTIVTNIYAPYRAPVFAALAERVRLHVVYCAFSGRGGMSWSRDPLPYSHTFVDGARITGRMKHTGGRPNRRSEYHVSPRIYAAIKASRPDVVVVGGYSVQSFYAWIYASLHRIARIVVSETTSESEDRLSPLQRLARTVLLRSADGAVGISQAAVTRLVELGMPTDRVSYSPYTTDIDRFLSIDRTLPRKRTGCIFLCVGRLVPAKGIDELLRAAAIVSKTQAGVRLRIVGEGPEKARLEQLAQNLGISEIVTFVGFLARDALPMEYQEADAFVFPTFHDPFGVVLVEAAAAGLALIASCHAGATGEIVFSGETGLIMDPSRPEDIANAMLLLAREPALRERLGSEVRKVARQRTPDRAASDLNRSILCAVQAPRARSLL